jgi:MFS family permease
MPQLPEGATGAAPQIPEVTVTDVVPLADGDSTGAGLAASVFPMVLGGMLGGILLTLLVQGVVRRLVGLLVFGIAAGALIALVMQTWFGILAGDWLVNASVLGLGVAATSALIIGLAALMGPAGIAVGAIITMFIANPIAGAAAPPQFLPEPWGAIGQFFVPGASANLLRSVMYFPDASTWLQWTILGAWLVVGVILALIGHQRTRAELTPPERQLEH